MLECAPARLRHPLSRQGCAISYSHCFHHSTAGRQALQQTIDQNEAKASELRGKLWTTVNGSAVYDQAEREKLQNDIDSLVHNDTAAAVARGSLNSHITGVNETIMGEFVTAHITAAVARAALQASIDTNAATMTITADQEQAIAATQEANMKALIIGSTICPDGQSINASSFAMRENVSSTTDYCTEDPVLVDFYGTTNQPVCCQ
jgi:hypothetical protein